MPLCGLAFSWAHADGVCTKCLTLAGEELACGAALANATEFLAGGGAVQVRSVPPPVGTS